jgi:hypothetical protein
LGTLNLQRFALKPKPRKLLKALLRNAFKSFLVVRLVGNCCKRKSRAQRGFFV